MTNANQVIEVLKNEIQINPVANAVLHVWALRRRARNSVTVSALTQRMTKEKFDFPKEEYAKFLKGLANLGLGTLETDKKGRVKALKGIDITLQSLGKAVCDSKKSQLTSFRARNKYVSLPGSKQPANRVTTEAAPAISRALPRSPISLVVFINNKTVSIPVPESLDNNEVAELVGRLQEAHVK